MKRSALPSGGAALGPALIALALFGVASAGVTAVSAETTRVILVGVSALLFMLLAAGAYLVHRDDRIRRTVEQNLLHRETQLRTILETAVDAVVSIDEMGGVEQMNAAAERMFGYSRQEVIGQNVKMLMPTSEQNVHDAHLARYRATGERRVIGIGREVVCRRKDGSEFPAELAVGECTVAGKRKFTGFLRDISERRKNELRIRDQAALLDKAGDAIWVRDLSGVIVFWNRAAEHLYGWSADEARGSAFAKLLGDQNPQLVESARKAVLSGDEWQGVLDRKTRDGKPIYVESRLSLLRDEAGQPKEILAIETDVTEKYERERNALRAQRLESIGTLADGIAHDLNNMLTPILMSAKLLRKDRPAFERDRLVDNILASAERGAEMIRQLLSFTGGIETSKAVVDLQTNIREITSLLEHTLPKSISIRSQVADDLWPVSGDSTQLSQVLMNLCVNARDAMPEGGELTILAENCVFDADSEHHDSELPPGRYVQLTVSDTGGGIPPEHIEHIFDPFFTTKAQGKGTGLGLATVSGIIRGHGGVVRLSSTLNIGTRFRILLPALESERKVAPGVVSAGPPAAVGKTILVVDDEQVILNAACATLEEAGYRVATAGDGHTAAKLLQNSPVRIDAALVDMMMPGMDGQATIRALQEVNPRLPVIASSGLRTRENLDRDLPGRIRAYLAKPYSAEALLATVAEILQEQPTA